jgi:hypothetical protein
MPLKLITDLSPNSNNNKAQAEAMNLLISAFVGGNELLEDALKDGDITVHVTDNMAQFGPQFSNDKAHWNGVSRQIRVHFTPDLSDQETYKRQLVRLCEVVLFELCNATNPLLNTKNKLPPLMFPTKEAYAKYMESLEFKSYQKYAAIVNATLRRDNTPEKEYYKEYRDDQFELYWDELVNAPITGDRGSRVHSDAYREAFSRLFIFCRDKIVSLSKAIKPLVFDLPQNISPSAYALKMAEKIMASIKEQNELVFFLLEVKKMTCPEIQRVLEIDQLLSILTPQSQALVDALVRLASSSTNSANRSSFDRDRFFASTTQVSSSFDKGPSHDGLSFGSIVSAFNAGITFKT